MLLEHANIFHDPAINYAKYVYFVKSSPLVKNKTESPLL